MHKQSVLRRIGTPIMLVMAIALLLVPIVIEAAENPGQLVPQYLYNFGYSVDAGANCDLDGDGWKDYIVGAPKTDRATGAVYVFSGDPADDGRLIRVIAGEMLGDNFGHCVACAGDVNNDGRYDLLVGAPLANVGSSADVGKIYLISFASPGGGFDAPDIKDTRKPQPPWWAVFEGEAVGQRFGWAVCDAGDLNDDGYDEFIVGSPGANVGGAQGVGMVQVFRGGPDPDENDIWDEHNGARAHDSAGYAVTGNRDFGSTSVKDYAYSAPYWDKPGLFGLDTLYDAGAVWVRDGADGNLISGELVNPLKGSQEGELSGWAITGGHFDLDGTADIIVGSPGKNNGKGAIKAYHGITLTAFVDATIDGQSTGDRFGHAVAYTPQLCPGQLDRQLFVGAPGTSVYTEGYIQVWERSTEDFEWEATPCQTESGAANNDRFGFAAASGGIWGEIQTVLIGAPGAGSVGEAYVYWGDSLVAVLTPDSGYSPFAAKNAPVGETVPDRFNCSVYPNPFNPSAEISFSLPAPAHVRLEIYNMLGQRVSTLVDDYLRAGSHTTTWNGINFSSGVYLYRLQAGDDVATNKMLLLK